MTAQIIRLYEELVVHPSNCQMDKDSVKLNYEGNIAWLDNAEITASWIEKGYVHIRVTGLVMRKFIARLTDSIQEAV